MRVALALTALISLVSLNSLGAPAHTKAALLLDTEIAKPGETVIAGLQLKMDPKWHTYWRNAGDAGDRTKIKWSLPSGITAGEILWPVPEKLDTAGIVTYIYHDEVVLLIPLTLAGNVAAGSYPLKADASWLECEEICLTGGATISATLTIGPERKASQNSGIIEAARKKLPQDGSPLAATGSWQKDAAEDTRTVEITWTPPAGSSGEWDFYPYAGEGFEVAGATEKMSASDGKLRLRKEMRKLEGGWPKAVAGLLLNKRGNDHIGYEVNVPIGAAGAPARSSLPVILALAFLGGLLLNIMPCVLPVIALKILSFVQQSKETPRRVRILGLLYGVGVLVSFGVLAGIAIAAQQAGGVASWGMALQNQIVRVLLTVVVTLVALNLFGLFEINLGGRVMGAAGDAAAKDGLGGAFFNGVLATVLATPCTAPFMTVAIAFAFTQPPFVTLLVFLAAGLGLATPFVALSWHPGWLRLLPKPGLWMERFKIAMGFPMLATAVWIFWFTAPEFGDNGVLWLGLFLVMLAAAAWVWGQFVQRSSARRGIGMAVAAVLVLSGYFLLLEKQLNWRTPPEPQEVGSFREGPDGIDWQRWSPEKLAQLRSEGRPVLVDFTSKRCLNCKVNKVTSLEIPSVRARLKELNAAALLADFSNNDPRIAAELRHYERAGVPLVLVYPRDRNAAPIVLPAILTPSIVLDALEKAGGQNVNLEPIQSSQSSKAGATTAASINEGKGIQ